MSDAIKDAILENATGPKRVEGDELKVEQHSLADQIAADKHVSSIDAVKKPGRGIRFSRLIPPGTI